MCQPVRALPQVVLEDSCWAVVQPMAANHFNRHPKKKNNIIPVNSINEKLDPNKHQAMMEIEDDSKEAGTIVQEIQKGFMLKDRLLRPSLVGVSKKPQKTKKNETKK